MRGSAWLVAGAAIAIWLACIVWPVAAGIQRVVQTPGTDVQIRSAGRLLVTSAGWAGGIALLAMAMGWMPGRWLGGLLHRRGFVPWAVCLFVPICIPAYVVFYAWWQSWPADSAVYRWAVAHQQIGNLRLATLGLGLLCWSWPLVAWCVAGSLAHDDGRRSELLMLDGAPWHVRVLDVFRRDAAGLALGGLLVFLTVFNNTTCFDLAEVFTFSNEIRAVAALGANVHDLAVAGTPAAVVTAAGVAVVWMILGGAAHRRLARTGRTSPGVRRSSLVIWLLTVVLPLAWFSRSTWSINRGEHVLSAFVSLYHWSVINTICLALIAASIAALSAAGLAFMWHDHRVPVRRAADVLALGWLIVGAMPGTMLGAMLEAGFHRTTPLDGLYRQWMDAMTGPGHQGVLLDLYASPAILVVGYLASFGFIGPLVSRWIALREPANLRDLRRLDGAATLVGLWTSTRPRLLAGMVAVAATMVVLSVGEIPVTAQLNPPMPAGSGPLALTMLNGMHYQRPQEVMAGTLLILLLAIAAALGIALAWRFMLNLFSGTQTPGNPDAKIVGWSGLASCLLMAVVLSGCVPDEAGSSDGVPRPLPATFTFGAGGLALGQFNYPRAIDIDPNNHWLYIIDKSARVQRFGFDGVPQTQWQMPEWANGKPTGVSIGPDGTIYVPDTHYYRVIAYTPDGRERFRFGGYGEGPGQFIYTTDIAFGPDDRIYISEYGGNDRVQVFHIVNDQPQFEFQFGSFGSEPGQFNRPQSMVFNPEKTELFISDACNHRIVVTDPQGHWLRTFGTAGREVGQLTFPYGLTLLPDGTLLVAEFGNNRIQRFDRAGHSLGVFGRIGRGMGELQYPWGVAAYGNQIFVLDSGNNRVQVMRRP